MTSRGGGPPGRNGNGHGRPGRGPAGGGGRRPRGSNIGPLTGSCLLLVLALPLLVLYALLRTTLDSQKGDS